MHTHLYEHTYANPTASYEHLRRTEPADLEIHEVTIGVSLLMGMSPTTESIAPINPGKYEHPCQVEDLNPGGQVLSKEPSQLIYDQCSLSFFTRFYKKQYYQCL